MISHNLHSEKGFSLIELMIVVAIIGILAAVAVPGYLSHIRKTRQVEGIHRLLDIKTAQEKYYALEDTYAPDLASLASYVSFDTADTEFFTFTVSDTSSLTTSFTILSQNDINGDTDWTDCWEIDEIATKPTQNTATNDCAAAGENINVSLFNF